MSEYPTVTLTPTVRLARALAREQALAQTKTGKTAWRPQPVLAISAWLNRLREDYFLDADDARTPISGDQAYEVWRSVIDTDIFIGEPRVADLAERAWRLLHEHRLTPPDKWPALLMNADHRRFQIWVRAYQALCSQHGWVDLFSWLDELPGLIEHGKVRPPDMLELAGFVQPPAPQQQRILEACEQAGSRIRRIDPAPIARPPCIEAYSAAGEKSELLAAATWARRELEQEPHKHIAIVVPDLDGRVEQAENALRRVFDPHGFALQPDTVEPWHVSLGKPLSRWPLTADALFLLRLNPERLSQPEIRRWLRMPFVHGWPEESLARAEVVTRLARKAPYELTLYELNRDSSAHVPRFQHTLRDWRKVREQSAAEQAAPSAWTAQFQHELSALGFGRGRALNSQEYQLLARWQHLLEQFSALDAVIAQPVRRSTAVRLLTERAGRTIFRERNPGVPVEVLGLKEALGSRFDAIWMTSMDRDAWPPPARREALIPGKIQQSVAESSSTGRLQQARLELDAVLAAAPRHVFSCCIDPEAAEQDRLTPLLSDVVQHRLELELDLDLEPPVAEMDVVPDESQAPTAEPGSYRGGTGLFQKQSDCPFRAFAEIRLMAKQVPTPRPGLDPGTRGSLVHKALEALWRALADSSTLQAMDQESLQQRIEQSAEQALREQFSGYRLAISQASRALEKQRLIRLLNQSLELEIQRPPFCVQAREHRVEIAFGGLQMQGTIDRIDRLERGDERAASTLLIDYKTGTRSGSGQWFPEARMRDVQLPAYALSVQPAPAGIAFARLLPAKVEFDGIQSAAPEADADVDPAAHGIRTLGQFTRKHALGEYASWPELLKDWREQLDALGRQFLAGRAEVDPRDARSCRDCHLHALCRIHERTVLIQDEAVE